jgi:signal peptidase II
MKYLYFFLLVCLIVAIDQTTKLLVYHYMEIGAPGQIRVFGDWFKIYYILNPGMAFGFEWGGAYGKIYLTSFRILASAAIAIYLFWQIKAEASKIYLFAISFILSGALGNLIDSIFYGVFLRNAPPGAITPWFNGQVIDMIYIDLWEGALPDWLPVIGGQYYAFWPVFNIADASIFIGVFTIIIFQRAIFKESVSRDETVQNA